MAGAILFSEDRFGRIQLMFVEGIHHGQHHLLPHGPHGDLKVVVIPPGGRLGEKIHVDVGKLGVHIGESHLEGEHFDELALIDEVVLHQNFPEFFPDLLIGLDLKAAFRSGSFRWPSSTRRSPRGMERRWARTVSWI